MWGHFKDAVDVNVTPNLKSNKLQEIDKFIKIMLSWS